MSTKKPDHHVAQRLALREASRIAKLRREAGILVTLDPVQRYHKHPDSRALAIKAKCYQCVGENCDPNFRGRIGNCPAKSCALWNFRPYQKFMNKPEAPEATNEEEESEDGEQN